VKPEPKPEPKLEPRPEPKPKVEPEPRPAKPDIALKAKEKEKDARRQEEQKKAAEEKRRQEEAQREEQERQKQLQALQRQQAEQQRAQQEIAANLARQQAAARGRLVNDYMGKINAKIKRLINNQACLPLGNPEVRFDVTLMPTGELLMDPKLTKLSGSTACDQAIERAIRMAQPLPLPPDPTLFSQFRELHLKFRPNENE
jgi:colicin import membrane protein